MITKFNTSAPVAGPKAEGGSGGGLLLVVGLIVLAWGVNEFIIKPSRANQPEKQAA